MFMCGGEDETRFVDFHNNLLKVLQVFEIV